MKASLPLPLPRRPCGSAAPSTRASTREVPGAITRANEHCGPSVRPQEDQMSATEVTEHAGVRPFRVSFPEEDLVDLRRRINATRWPERETVDDDSQGPRLAMMQELARY